MKPIPLLTLTLALLLPACDDDPTGPASPAIQTDRTAYTLERAEGGWAAEIPYVFVNRTGRALYTSHCGGIYNARLDRLEDGEWVEAWYPPLPLCLGVPQEIEPGEAVRDTVFFFEYDGEAGADGSDLPGTYRIVWQDVRFGGPSSDGWLQGAVPVAYRSSNAFELRR
jgi:hypothetical protein